LCKGRSKIAIGLDERIWKNVNAGLRSLFKAQKARPAQISPSYISVRLPRFFAAIAERIWRRENITFKRIKTIASRTLKVTWVNLLVMAVLLVLAEASLQLFALLHPSYDVLFLQPDRVLGWKQVPNLRWVWAGLYWYASDFKVDITTNPLGFRDKTRAVTKPYGVKRVALLGDSFIEAVQVPLEKTAGQLLEQRLNSASAQDREASRRWEVLNFGISNYGVGQYLLAWEQYARNYEPDYIAIFVAKFHMERTVEKYKSGLWVQPKSGLWVRPTFRLENDVLIREPARDFDEFVRVQDDLIKGQFAGKRSRKTSQLIIPVYASLLNDRFMGWVRQFVRNSEPPVRNPDADMKLFAINQKIIEELGRQASRAGGKLVVLDASRYFGDDETVPDFLRELCRTNGFGYVPLDNELLKANRDGISTRWTHDGHFNEAGNRILAEAFYSWMTNQVPVNKPQ
jgi:hypothetical protein